MLIGCQEKIKRDFTNLFTNYSRCNKCFKYEYCYIGYLVFITLYTNSTLETLKLLSNLNLRRSLVYLSKDLNYQELLAYSYLNVERIIYICELECTFNDK